MMRNKYTVTGILRMYQQSTNLIGSYVFGEGNRWGHYWTEVNDPFTGDFQINPDFSSYGWYPDEESFEEFGTINEGLPQDPHAPGFNDVPNFNPTIDVPDTDCPKKCKEAAQCVDNFAGSYNGLWNLSTRNCRSFQREMMKNCGLKDNPNWNME